MKKLLSIFVVLIFVFTCFATTIYDVQYTTVAGDGTYPSLLEGEIVTLYGIVTGAGYYSSGSSNRFFLSDPEGGAWKGVFIFNYDFIVEMGDEVEVSGTVLEYYGLTEITSVSDVTILSSGNPVPEPIIVETGNLIDPVDAEQYEGCLVNLQDVTVTEEQIEYGQWYVSDGTGDCQMDDAFFQLENVVPPIVIVFGDVWASLIGQVDYSFEEYGVNPRTPEDMVHDAGTGGEIVPAVKELIGNYPNPFNPVTTIEFSLDNPCFVSIDIFNIKGEKIKTLVQADFEAQVHQVVWNGENDNGIPVSSGVYFYEMNTGDYTCVKKMILMK